MLDTMAHMLTHTAMADTFSARPFVSTGLMFETLMFETQLSWLTFSPFSAQTLKHV
jgi:hypothetical protein